MQFLRRYLDRVHPLFAKGGRFQKYNAIYEMVDTLLYTPPDVTRGSPHVRDGLDLKRLMIFVVLAVTPVALVGMYNTGYQANTAMLAMGVESTGGWRGAVLEGLAIGYSPDSIWACFWHGFLYFLPIYLVTMAAGGFWETLFAAVRNHEVNEGFLVTSMLFTLTLPPTIPLWQVALGISFGIVIGKEIFGGTGRNFLNPALTARAFLYFAYPVQISGNNVWTTLLNDRQVPVDGFTGATPLSVTASAEMSADVHNALLDSGYGFWKLFIGHYPGSIGGTTAVLSIAGAVFLLILGLANYRIILGCILGALST